MRSDNWEMIVREMRAASREGAFSDADFDVYRQAWWRRGAITGMLNWYRAFLRRPVLLPLSRRLDMPVLVLWGGGDTAQGRELAFASLDLCQRGKPVYFAHATHWLQHEKTHAVNARLADCFAADEG